MSEPERSPSPYVSDDAWDLFFEQSAVALGLSYEAKYLRVNTAMCELLGRPAEEIVGADIRSFLGPDTKQALREQERAIAAGATRGHLEGAIIQPDGSERWASMDAVIVLDSNKEFVLTMIECVDLSSLNQARINVAASERRIRKLLTNARDIVSLVAADGTMQFTTAEQVGALGYED